MDLGRTFGKNLKLNQLVTNDHDNDQIIWLYNKYNFKKLCSKVMLIEFLRGLNEFLMLKIFWLWFPPFFEQKLALATAFLIKNYILNK
ncbi:hypothetical protein BpHYR1_051430 [Brachionus plicatilis]|uniref:Uncharacterized protein n=1 Tax=Brachionus plicatilis TaxID=10195 RepID=A0A3M7SMZ2_BRAPC|nr:hypothetical protein BpHYR1_051430 [Brachionus plicatilis]